MLIGAFLVGVLGFIISNLSDVTQQIKSRAGGVKKNQYAKRDPLSTQLTMGLE